MKRLIMSFFVCFLIANMTCALAFAQTVTPIVRDVDLIKIINSTEDGNQNITIVRANLNNPNLAIKTLFSDDGASVRENVKSLADERKAIAAVNADFFAWGDKSGTGSPIGYNVVDGELISSPCIAENVAAAATNKDGENLFAYFQRQMTITSPRGVTEEIKHINKYDDLSGIVMYTPVWGKYSLGSSGTQVEVVVDNDIVKEIRRDQPAAEIPKNGYILAGLSDVTSFLTEYVKVGDKLKLDIKITPEFDAENVIGGGTILVTEGVEAEITHNITGRQPRSAFGVDKTGKIVYLITVDGRDAGGSIGMTLAELRSFMIDYGIYNGINFDGGGSTQLAVRQLGENESTIMNTVCETPYRKVINALGIVSTGKAGIAEMIDLNVEMPTMFVNTGISVSADLYDQVYKKMDGDIDISLSGVKGSIDDELFIPAATGTAVISAKSGDITASSKVKVLSGPDILKLNSDSYYMKSGERKVITMTGYTSDGEMVYINPKYAKFSQTNPILKSIDGGIEATGRGITQITYKLGNATASATVSVDSDIIDAEYNNQTDRFEQANGSVYVYPSNVSGAYKISNEKAKSGQTSGKLWYDFLPEMDVVQCAGISFSNPIEITQPNSQLKVDVYANSTNKQWLRYMLTDANGELHRLDLASVINWNGWRKVTAKVPDDIALPAKLTKIYVVQPDKILHTKGAVYFDDLTVDINPTISITACIEEENNFINRLADMKLKTELAKSGVSLNFADKSLGNTKTVRNGIAIIKLKDFKNSSLTWFSDSINSAEEKTIVITTGDNPKNEPGLISIITAMKNKGITPVFVYKAAESKTEKTDDVNYVSLRSVAPSVTKHINTIDLFNIYVKDGKTELKIETLNLW